VKNGVIGVLLFIVGFMVMLVLGFALKYFGVIGERLVFKESHQYVEAKRDQIHILQAQLAEIEVQLAGELTKQMRSNLEAQAAMIRVQLNQARSK